MYMLLQALDIPVRMHNWLCMNHQFTANYILALRPTIVLKCRQADFEFISSSVLASTDASYHTLSHSPSNSDHIVSGTHIYTEDHRRQYL